MVRENAIREGKDPVKAVKDVKRLRKYGIMLTQADAADIRKKLDEYLRKRGYRPNFNRKAF